MRCFQLARNHTVQLSLACDTLAGSFYALLVQQKRWYEDGAKTRTVSKRQVRRDRCKGGRRMRAQANDTTRVAARVKLPSSVNATLDHPSLVEIGAGTIPFLRIPTTSNPLLSVPSPFSTFRRATPFELLPDPDRGNRIPHPLVTPATPLHTHWFIGCTVLPNCRVSGIPFSGRWFSGSLMRHFVLDWRHRYGVVFDNYLMIFIVFAVCFIVSVWCWGKLGFIQIKFYLSNDLNKLLFYLLFFCFTWNNVI